MADRAHAPLLAVSSLSVAYGDAGEPAVRGVSFTLPTGGALGIAGESGAGKSTLALAILGLLPPTARCDGSIRIAGDEILGEPAAVRRLRWRTVAIVFQDAMSAFNPVVTVGEQIAEAWVVHEGATWRQAMGRAAELLDRVGLEPALVHSYPHELSGGMRQRAAIAMAIALAPPLVIVDEPTSALDVLTGNAIAELLRTIRRQEGTALLLISHDVSVIARTCDSAAIMSDGAIVEQGPAHSVLSAPEHPYTRRLIDAVPRLPVPLGGPPP